MKYNWQHWTIVIIFWVALISPIGFYAYQFGFGIWGDNQNWANMGSAIGGLYTPILSLFTFFLIGYQLWRQNQIERHNQLIWQLELFQKSSRSYLDSICEVGMKLDGQDDLLTILKKNKNNIEFLLRSDADNQRLLMASIAFFKRLDRLMIMNNTYAKAVYDELISDALSRLGIAKIIFIETHVIIVACKLQHSHFTASIK